MEVIHLDNQIQKRKRAERKQYILNATHRDLDTRDRHLGIKHIKQEYQPKTYHFRGTLSSGEPITIHNRAEAAAQHLETNTRGNNRNANQARPRSTILKHTPSFDTSKIKLKEVQDYLKNAKRRKAPGPDDL